MKSSASGVVSRVLTPLLAWLIVLAAFLATTGTIPRLPVVSELIGLSAVFVAPGLAAEPALRGRGWTAAERFGLAASLSLASCALAGVLLHIAGLAVSSGNILLVLLGVTAVFGLASLKYRSDRPFRSVGRFPTDAIVGFCGLAILGAAFAAILLIGRSPAQPHVEIVLVDESGTLLAQPVPLAGERGGLIRIAFRSPSGAAHTLGLTLRGDGLQPTTREIHPKPEWATVDLPVIFRRAGTFRASIEVSGDGIDLVIPVEFETS
jgi:hypothetical protein